ncbi:DUF4082 domain-containing protein [Spirosoma rhododendri]|uniref:DUF4082 domain-containing protein n=1 Tax=Spirosoma rhododendri TaxID=2728024 RepID=A0A7L5DN42_9BACT|nr:DUF4082 domain-containing protein [Spirosoma rhododendri]QJD79904.1 DUF4082 domain-containing protein [Spirosoma rhododendri]
MKSILLVGLTVAGLLSLNSCQKGGDTAKPAENPVTSFMTSETTITTDTRTSGPWELGIVLSASTAGKITQVGSRMVDPGNYRIIIWDNDTKQILRQKTISQTAPNTLTMGDIESLAVAANKKLMVSINNQADGVTKKYNYAHKGSSLEFMPFTKGNILVYNSAYRQTGTATFPDQTINVKYEMYGFPEITFIAD